MILRDEITKQRTTLLSDYERVCNGMARLLMLWIYSGDFTNQQLIKWSSAVTPDELRPLAVAQPELQAAVGPAVQPQCGALL